MNIPVHILLGFDDAIAKSLLDYWTEGEAIVILHATNSAEIATIKRWWMDEVESVDRSNKRTLVISQDEPYFGVNHVSALISVRPNDKFDVQVLCKGCFGFGERTAQKLKLRKLLNRLEGRSRTSVLSEEGG